MTALSGIAALLKVLSAARERIQVDDAELTEARRRRGRIQTALKEEFGPDCRVYLNGSVAHGDALTPLTDIDLGVVVPNPDGEFGPYANGPAKLQDRAANAIRDALKGEFPLLRVITGGRKRSVYVAFGAPVDPNESDFSADVIVAIDYPWGNGLWIPNYETWDRSDPEAHTRLVRDAIKLSNVNYTRTVRLLKHWVRRHSKLLCSWNIKALGLSCITGELNQLDGMVAWFDYAIADLSRRETPDPAGVAGPISIPGDRAEVVGRLTTARAKLVEAINYANDGYDVLAVDALAVFFNDPQMLPRPSDLAVQTQRLERAVGQRATRSPAVTAPVRSHTPVRSWAP
ncbi:Nucleotidyltransferase domain-containing protein [Nakamurella panacisegetis]|uniref:Nucleotidyltransferase domain-containing protein n=1 Tax=Nakamurella panacisegetis TaxID=1090615 RepID=A0A1H0KM53_9ACTN|nr:nucleotidyltransferase [Nakamurella panacisegetis]SDO57074.1 Nucleotidyltransferase domain-containing protein [Nakamurella panacisegetis]